MLANLDLNHLLTFPFKEPEARKQFLIGALVYLASFVIPILPLLVATGYVMRIMRQVLRGEEPRMWPGTSGRRCLSTARGFLGCAW